jgi:cyclase
MRRIRVIPTLLLQDRRLVKTTGFKNPSYVGDPINAVKIFNEKEVDEICILDIGATRKGAMPDLTYIQDLTSECFMPLSYGGAITKPEQANTLFKAGVEKVVLGTAAAETPDLVTSIAEMAGIQSVVVSVDVRKNWIGKKHVYITNGTGKVSGDVVAFAKQMESAGAGEILLQCIDREGTLTGYDLDLIHAVSNAVSVPVIASGGAASPDDFLAAVKAGASAVAAGAMFVYKGPNRAVLINYPDQATLKLKVYDKL